MSRMPFLASSRTQHYIWTSTASLHTRACIVAQGLMAPPRESVSTKKMPPQLKPEQHYALTDPTKHGGKRGE